MMVNLLCTETFRHETRLTLRPLPSQLLPGSGYASAIVILSWISGSINGPKLKRAITLSLVNAMANTPNIWTRFTPFSPSSTSPHRF